VIYNGYKGKGPDLMAVITLCDDDWGSLFQKRMRKLSPEESDQSNTRLSEHNNLL